MSIKRLNALKQRKAAAVEAMNTILAAAGDANLTDEQATAFASAKAEAAAAQAGIEQVSEAIEAARNTPAIEIPDGARITTHDNRADSPTHGFAHAGEFFASVRSAALRPSAVDERLMIGAAATTYANETTGADGGFLVPPTYSQELMGVIEDNEPLLARTRQIPISGNTLIMPASEETAHGTTGVQAYWEAEAATMTQTKPVFQNREIKATRLAALVPVTEESLEDSAALGNWVSMLAGEKMAFKVSDAILNGTGVGQPLGIVGANGTVSVAKETSQVAATIVAENVLKMWSRMPVSSRSRAVWLVHTDCEVQLAQMNIKIKNVAGSENVGGIAVGYALPSPLTGPNATLFGRPVVPVEACAALGTTGDIVLADLSKYITVTKGAVKADQSMHFFFDQNARAFRFVLRLGGQPWLSTAISRKNGTSTLSHFVKLDTRA